MVLKLRKIFPNAIKIMGVYSESPKRPVNIQGIDKKYFCKKHQFACVHFHLKLQYDYFPCDLEINQLWLNSSLTALWLS